jgi:hypothetical protein
MIVQIAGARRDPLVASAVCAAAETPAVLDKGADITPMCGTKPTRIAPVDGYGGDTWQGSPAPSLRTRRASARTSSRDVFYPLGARRRGR